MIRKQNLPKIEIGVATNQITQQEIEELKNTSQEILTHLITEWKINYEEIKEREITLNILPHSAFVDEDHINIPDKDTYEELMKANYSDERVEKQTRLRDMPFHNIPEELGQWLGSTVNNDWNYKGSFKDVVRDETHGALAINEFLPWMMDLQKQVFEKDIEIIRELHNNDEIEYIQTAKKQHKQYINNRYDDFLNEVTDEEWDSYQSFISTIVDEAPDKRYLVESHNNKSPESPQSFSVRYLESVLPLSYDEFDSLDDEAVDKLVAFHGSEEEDEIYLRNTSFESSSKWDRAYLISRLLAEDICEEDDFGPGDFVRGEVPDSYFNDAVDDYNNELMEEFGAW